MAILSFIWKKIGMFHQSQLRIPLRSTKSVQDMAGMGEGKSSNNLLVTGFTTGPPSYTIPPLLTPGLPGYEVSTPAYPPSTLITITASSLAQIFSTTSSLLFLSTTLTLYPGDERQNLRCSGYYSGVVKTSIANRI